MPECVIVSRLWRLHVRLLNAHNKHTVPPWGLDLNSKCMRADQEAREDIIALCDRGSEWGTGRGLTPDAVSGDGWWVITGKYSAFAPANSISAVRERK